MNSSFLDIVKKWSNFDYSNFFETITNSELEAILNKNSIDDLDFLKLLSPKSDHVLESVAKRSRSVTINEFGKTVQIYAPIYLSNYCKNRCVYCGFNCSNKIKRSMLTPSDIERECEYLKSHGIRHILLLTGGDREKTPPSYILESVKVALKFFDSVSIEVYSLTEDEYRDFYNAGVHNLTIYQETYNLPIYKKLHLSGEKKDYYFRLDAPQRAAEANFRSINIGALLGLDRPIVDFFISALHCKYLYENYPSTEVSISLPRIRKSTGGFQPEYTLSDIEYVKFLTAFRIFLPKCGVSVSTRESGEFRDKLLNLGVTKMSAGSKTDVGGYNGSKSDEQFTISDDRSIEEIDLSIRNYGYQPVYKDWVCI